MDDTDLRLCQMLLVNSRLPYREIAGRLGLSVQAVHKRIQVLQGEGVIRRFRARLSASHLGAVPVYVMGVSEAMHLDTVLDDLGRNDSIGLVISAGGNLLFIEGLVRGVSDLEPYVESIKAAATMPAPSIGVQSLRQVGDVATTPLPRQPVELSQLDYRIIHALAGDSRAALVDVAKALGVSVKTVARRLERLDANGVLEYTIDIEMGATAGATAMIRIWLVPGQDRNLFRGHLRQRFGARMLVYTAFGNVTDYMFLIMWSPTSAAHAELVEELERDERVAGVKAHLLYSGRYYETWRERLVADMARRE